VNRREFLKRAVSTVVATHLPVAEAFAMGGIVPAVAPVIVGEHVCGLSLPRSVVSKLEQGQSAEVLGYYSIEWPHPSKRYEIGVCEFPQSAASKTMRLKYRYPH
jgi:hypothetical protein